MNRDQVEQQIIAHAQATLAGLQSHVAATQDDPFVFTEDEVKEFSARQNLIPSVKVAIARGFHVFGLTPKDKIPLPGSQGFKDSKSPDDASVLTPWNQDPSRNIGIDLGASDLCVLDFDRGIIPDWVSQTKTYKVKTSRGLHVYFRGARKTGDLHVDGVHVGEIKSQGGYVLAEGSVHP